MSCCQRAQFLGEGRWDHLALDCQTYLTERWNGLVSQNDPIKVNEPNVTSHFVAFCSKKRLDFLEQVLPQS